MVLKPPELHTGHATASGLCLVERATWELRRSILAAQAVWKLPCLCESCSFGCVVAACVNVVSSLFFF